MTAALTRRRPRRRPRNAGSSPGGSRSSHQRRDVDRQPFRLRRPGKQQQILHQLVERIDARDDFTHHLRRPCCRRHAAADHLNRAADAGERVLHLVRDDGRHLAKRASAACSRSCSSIRDARAEVVQDAGELRSPAVDDLADGQVQRERRAILAPAGDLAADADDLAHARSPGSAPDSRRALRDTATASAC